METRRNSSGAVDLGVDLAGVDLAAGEDLAVGAEDGDGDGNKAKSKRKQYSKSYPHTYTLNT